MSSTTKQRHMRPRARTAPDGPGAWPGATYPDCSVSPSLTDAATLADYVVPVDPRLLLGAPPSWTPSQLAVSLALAGMWMLGAKDCSARWFAIRCNVSGKEMRAALATAARGPGRPAARLESNRVILERAEQQLRTPAAYWRLDVGLLARTRTAQDARAWLLFGQAAASKRKDFTLHMTAAEARQALALRHGVDPMPVLRKAVADLAEHFSGHRLQAAETPDGVVLAAPRTAFRTRWMPPHVLSRFGIFDGQLGFAGLDLGVGRTESMRAWLGAREEHGLRGHFGAAKNLWLAVVSAAAESIESPVPGFSTEQLRAALIKVGPAKAFDSFVAHLVKQSGATPSSPAPLPWMIGAKDSKVLAAARLARAKGEPRIDVGPITLVPYVAPYGPPVIVDGTYLERAIRDCLEGHDAAAVPEATTLIRRWISIMWQPTENTVITQDQRTARRDMFDTFALRGVVLGAWDSHQAELRPLYDAWTEAEGGADAVWGIVRSVESIWFDAVLEASARMPGREIRTIRYAASTTRQPVTAKVRAERLARVDVNRARLAARAAAKAAGIEEPPLYVNGKKALW
ncbi:hypothetical protein NON00_12900 [Roseomonas sp. GC11]|uniref:hypothetical protein n=1 Tax=Roseomonas sp. GC11 TaxID=2950546 RepID=UPI00210D942C|nr:hypothetical protein [Roseomonas sp. GC11]MCQ4160826.1 hypothetical protein [Roseomonas sp. GC11]